jgi:hypothetical protein
MFQRLPLQVTRSRIASRVINWSERSMAAAAQHQNDSDGF